MAAAPAQARTAMRATGRIPDLICAGHVHDYQRHTRDGAAVGATGPVTYVVAGHGGYPNLHSLDLDVVGLTLPAPFPGMPDVTINAADATHHGYTRVRVTRTHICLQGRARAGQRFGARVRTWASPTATHPSRASSVPRAAGDTRSQPPTVRPRISIGATPGLSSSSGTSAGGHRTISPPPPLAATAMCPATRKARPPNMACSSQVAAPSSAARTRSASASS